MEIGGKPRQRYIYPEYGRQVRPFPSQARGGILGSIGHGPSNFFGQANFMEANVG
jgi:hypothetical protein